jgi:hypothetical protein
VSKLVSLNRNIPIIPSLPFPVDVFPPKCRQIINEIAEAYAVSPGIPGITLLTLAGAAIGNSRAVGIKKDWREFPNIFSGIVAHTGIGKSPPIAKILEPIKKIEKIWLEEYKQERSTYENIPKKSRIFLQHPQKRQLIVDDITTDVPEKDGNKYAITYCN